MDQFRHHYLQQMGITVWVPKDSITESAEPDSPPTPEIAATLTPDLAAANVPVSHMNNDSVVDRGYTKVAATAIATADWQQLQQLVAGCRACHQLASLRTQTVFGSGDTNATLLIVGEAPGSDEDKHGQPFVGRAGQLLTAMLYAIGLQRNKVYIANIVKCRPPENRDPHVDEIANCAPFLQRQIGLLQPKVVLALGRIAAHSLLQSQLTVGKLRNQTHYYGETKIPLIVSYHPAYLLRSPLEKQKSWQDLVAVQQLLQQTVP